MEDRRVEPEDLRQHAGGEAGSQFPAVGRAFTGGEVFTLSEGDCHRIIRVWIHQQVVLGQEAGKQHTVPVLVGDLFDQAVDLLDLGLGMAHVAQLPSVNPETAAQLPVLSAQVGKGRCFANTELFQRSTSGVLGDVTRIPDGTLELVS